MKKEWSVPDIVSDVETWWQWLRRRARSKAVFWISVIALAIDWAWWNWPERTKALRKERAGISEAALGAALLILGERRGDEKTLEEAIAVFREALKEFTRERVPLDWAGTQTNLGYALTTLARQRGDKGVLLEVISVSRKVLAELKGKGAMAHTEAARNTLRRAERSLAALPARTSRARH